MLLRPTAFDALVDLIGEISSRVSALRSAIGSISDDGVRAQAIKAADDFDLFTADLRRIVDAMLDSRLTEVLSRIDDHQPPLTTPGQLRAIVFALRRQRIPEAPIVSGLAAEIDDVVRWLDDTKAYASAPLIAIVGPAGRGKTHLSAQVTAPADRSTAGVFILGSHLRAAGTLDDLARRVPGITVNGFDSLLEAVNSAGARAGSRIPIVIDGLNEAERPSEWRVLLEELMPALGLYPHVKVIITLRDALAARAVPEDALTTKLEWLAPEVHNLEQKYFDHYLIDPAGAWVPARLFHNPLFLRMYCEAANLPRQESVGVEALPTSMVGVFELYRDRVCDRLANDPAHQNVPTDQIKRRLAALALKMWDRRVRSLPSDDAKALLDVGPVPWDDSIFRRLEEEGVLLRDEVDGGEDTETALQFDRFAGYLIADALLARMTYTEIEERLASPDLWLSLLGENAHPLGEDVAITLTGLLPRRFTTLHLWKVAPTEHRPWATYEELESESEYLDDDTINAIATQLVDDCRSSTTSHRPRVGIAFDRLWELAASPAHRLNARFLDRVLKLVPLAARDLSWSEWIRYHASDPLRPAVESLSAQWSVDLERRDADELRALAIAWLLTSTNRQLRDSATMALQRFGRSEPGRLFELSGSLLDIDDPYLVVRIVGAAFGAASAHQMPDPGGSFEHALEQWLVNLRRHFLIGGSVPTSHEQLRDYVRATFEFAAILHANAAPSDLDPFALNFANPLDALRLADDDPRTAECGATLKMDFENYVIGSAIAGRHNYDSTHPGFQRARGEVLARIWELGWRSATFETIDNAISRGRSGVGVHKARVERYGKKYGWIAYYELVGRLVDRSEHRERWTSSRRELAVDIDLTFPTEPPAVLIDLPEWAPVGVADEPAWILAGAVEVADQLWAPDEISGVSGGWLLAEGFLEHRGDGRRVFGFFRTLILDPGDVDPALAAIAKQSYLGNDFFPSLLEVRDVYAGELPWSPRFQVRVDDEGPLSYPALRADWNDGGIAVSQIAVDLGAAEGEPPIALSRAYVVPSFEFAARFGLRQLPGSLDLVTLDGRRASATFHAEEPWTGNLLFIRQDLIDAFADGRGVLQVAWGERDIALDRHPAPSWLHEIYQEHGNIWREVRKRDAR